MLTIGLILIVLILIFFFIDSNNSIPKSESKKKYEDIPAILKPPSPPKYLKPSVPIVRNKNNSPKILKLTKETANRSIEDGDNYCIIPSPRPKIFTDIPSDLREFIGASGHNSFPCLSKIYSESSLVLCTDFTPWLIQKVKDIDTLSLKKFIYSIMSSSPVLIPSWEEYKKTIQTWKQY